MIKLLMLGLILFGLTACGMSDKDYYQENVNYCKKLSKAEYCYEHFDQCYPYLNLNCAN